MDCCGGARTKNSGLLVPSQHLFSLGGLLGESSENVRQRKGNMGMEKGGSKGNKIIVQLLTQCQALCFIYVQLNSHNMTILSKLTTSHLSTLKSCFVFPHSDYHYQKLHDILVYSVSPPPQNIRSMRVRTLSCSMMYLQCLEQCLTQQVFNMCLLDENFLTPY